MATIDLIAHTEVGPAGASSVNFSSIANTFDDLWIMVTTRAASGLPQVLMRFNNETSTTTYSTTSTYGFGNVAQSDRQANANGVSFDQYNMQANTNWTSINILIPQYKNTSNFKQSLIDYYSPNNQANSSFVFENYCGGRASLWRNTGAISSIQFTLSSGSFVEKSTFTLYGITKA
jgi:hypothetical protein